VTITITIPEQLDERAAAEAHRRAVSKSELIRQGLGTLLPPAEGADTDPWRSFAGFGSPDVRVDHDFAAAGFVEVQPSG
jgi:hypothetical protein